MASRFDLPAPWTKDARKVTPMVLEINGSGAAAVLQPVDKYRVKNTKPLGWVLLPNTRGAVGCIAWLGAALWSRLRAVKKRLVLRQVESPLLKLIGSLLVLAVATLALELVACWNGWHLEKKSNLQVPETDGIVRWMRLAYVSWRSFRANYVVYPVQTLANFCVVLFILMLLDRFVLFLGWMWIKLKKIKPRIEGKRFRSSDEIPMVLVQIPMCNEREVYRQSIFCSCRLDWPKDRLLIQVLDDSDDDAIQALIRSEVSIWSELGMNIIYRHRSARTGYKAGNLKSGMSCDYVKDYEFVAIFDADFQPKPDFLKKTIPHFKDNSELGLVQARWSFVNKDENLLTRLQNVNLSFHFEVEQQVGGAFFNFFGFNGTAGVWRIKALEGSGGWLDRTTVEDMDIAVRAHLNGWKFIFLDDVKVLCEAPESYEAYKKQQYRWHSGPMLLFQLCLPAIITSKIPLWKKGNLILLFFLLRKLLLPFYCFTLFCIVLPSTMFVPEVKVPMWVICYAPIFMSLFNNLPHPRSLPLVMPYLLFENTMSVTKFDAMISGLFQMGNSHEWIVTQKAGRLFESAEKDSKTLNHRNKLKGTKSTTNKSNKIYKKELALALLLLTAAVRNLLSFEGIYFCLLLFQGMAFLIVGLDLIGEQIM